MAADEVWPSNNRASACKSQIDATARDRRTTVAAIDASEKTPDLAVIISDLLQFNAANVARQQVSG